MQLSGSLPSGSKALVPQREITNPTRERFGRIYKVSETGYTHIASSTSTAVAPSNRVPEKNSLKFVRGTGRLWTALTKRDFVFFREVERAENQPRTWCCSGRVT